MDSILNSALAEICSELQNGLSLQALWPRLDPSLSSSNLDLSPHLKQALWDALRSIPTLKFDAKNAPYGPADPSILSFEDAEKLNLKLVADEGLRDNFMGLYNVRSANASLSKIQRMALERLVTARTNGITQSQLAKELGIEGRNFHYAVKSLECQGLIVKQSALLKTKEAGDSPFVTTNMLYLYRHGKHLGSQQKIEITKEEQTRESFGNGNESPASGDNFAGKYVKEDVLVKDYLPEMKAVCDKLEEANGKVLVVSDIKKDLGYSGTPGGHKAWRKVCRRLKAAGLVELFDAKVNEKVECCLRFPENSTQMSLEPKSLLHVDDHCNEEQQVKYGQRKKCQITDQLVELPIEQQIYELIDSTGSEGLTRNEVLERLGINNKKNCNRLAGMWSRFGMNIQPEMHQKAKTYRFWTPVEHNSESANPFLNKSENGNENKITDLYIGSSVALDRSGQSQTRSAYDCSTLKGYTAGSRNMKNRYINTEPSGGSPQYSESNHMLLCPGNPQPLFLEPKDTTCDSKLSLLSTVEINGASPETPPAALKPLGSGSDPRYPCLSLTEDSTRREKRILERLQDEKFILRAELYRWLVSLEKDKCTTTDRKTIDRILKKLQELGHCKCIHINVPVVTNCGRSRTTLVVLHPSVQSLTPELVSEIHDTWRSFEIQSRGQCSSRWKKSGSVPVLKDVQRTQNHVGTDIRAMRSEAMRSNGFILAKMIRAKLLHSFLWDFLSSSTGSDDALASGKDVIELKNPHSRSKLFSLEAAIRAIPVELFLQVVGCTKKIDDMLEKCKRGLCLSDLSADEYKSLMDTHATGRLSLVIEILRRLKLIRMVSDEHLKDAIKVPHAISTHALEFKPYIEEPLSKDAISLSFRSVDLRPRIRHDFVLSNREAVDEYWQTLEYCYAAADPRAALHAFPGSAVHEVSLYRSWTKIRVMTAAQRDELLKRVEKDDPSEKLSFKECGKIAKDLNLTLEQVLRVYYDKRHQRLHGLQNKRDEVQPKKGRRVSRKRKRSSEQESVNFTETDEVTAQLEELGNATLSDTVKQFIEEKSLLVTSSDKHDTHLEPLVDHLETGQEPEPNEDDDGCHSIISKCSFSNLKSTRTYKKEKLQSTRQRRFSWTEAADRQLIIQYVRHRATLGPKYHRIDWTSLPDLPAPPSTCQKRMALLKSNKRFRIAVMRLCNVIGERYAKFLEKTQNRSLTKDDCRLLLRGSTGEDNDRNLPNISNHNQGTGVQEEPWDDFDDNNIKRALEEVLHYKRMAKLDASKRVGSTCQDWSDLNTNAEEYDPQESELIASTTPYEDVQNHSGRGLKISARRSCCQHLNEKFFKLLHGVNVSTQVYKSLAVSNAVELFKLVFLSISTAPEVPNLLAEILRRYSECDLFAAFNYLRDRKIMVGGNDSQHFSLSQQFLHNISMSPFPTNSGKRATKFAHWLREREKDLMEGGIDLSADLQCGDIFHLFALVSSGELSISPCLPDEGMGEAEDLRSSKRKIDSNEFLDGDKTKKLKSFVAAEGEIISRREKGFPGIKVSVYRASFSTADAVDLFTNDTPCVKKIGGSYQLDSTCGQNILSHFHHMKEILDSSSTVHVLENCSKSPWEGMVRYAEHLLPSCSSQNQSSPIHPEVFRSIYSAIQTAGDQGLSIEDVSQITNIPGEKMTEFIIDVLQTFERVLKVNAYDSIRVVDSLYRGKYFMTSVPGICQKLEPPSGRKPQRGNDGDLFLHPKNCDSGCAHLQGDINMHVDDVHKVTFLNFPEEVCELSYKKQTSSELEGCMEGIEVSPRGDGEGESSKSFSGKLCVPILPWINGDGTINKIIYKGLRRRVLGIVMQNPGILEDEIIRRMDVLNPQSCRKLLELLILDKHISVRKMHQTTSNGLPPILRTLFGSSFTEPKLVFREHFFANPTSTSLL
ncbi:hypothetical protein L3X38_016017 [Prunus dulcis]|uniref:B-block binding subunit of TFIIIC n=1 Tax=Prunus dulcis TaxID=3755 RepID=A0AAD4W4J1_PRUDU|nr:hypothetical protein L3X38_016017 [Prunus dulcis]